ncbi:MAG: DUF3656 domain-containing U32 family peptidase [Bacillota bacterium]
MTNVPELLAPAGGMEALRAAVENGADAVYLGGQLFNARQYASNFSNEELQEAINYAHVRGVKIYVTLNTLLDNNELKQAAEYLRTLYNIGADAIIVQDLGLLWLVRSVFPEMEVHASTQMTILNAAGVKYLARHGIRRVVLARELSLKAIQEIGLDTGVELEVFVHGALCFSYSGQCLMSSMIGGRSGNRGRCAQPCRLAYTLTDASGQAVEGTSPRSHLLSTRDLCTIEILPELVKAGITSFKFEGRMKRPEYVATVIRVYRQALDRYLASSEEYAVGEDELRDLYQIFNREFTPGYFLGNPGAAMMSHGRPNNRGLYLGRVIRNEPQKKLACLRLEEELGTGDGIDYWITQGGHRGMVVHNILKDGETIERGYPGDEVWLETGFPVKVGDRVFKTHDEQLVSNARQTFTSSHTPRKIPVYITVMAVKGQPFTLEINDDEGNRARVVTGFIVQQAEKRELTGEICRQQLERLGNTPFLLGGLRLELESSVMVPLSEINAARREAIKKLELIRANVRQRPSLPGQEYFRRISPVIQELEGNEALPSLRLPGLAVSVRDPRGAQAALASGADRVYAGGEQFRSQIPFKLEGWRETIDAAHAKGREIVFTLPRIWHQEETEKVQAYLEQLKGIGANAFLAGNPGTLELARSHLAGSKIYGDYPLNVFNDLAIKHLGQEGLAGITLSPELTFKQIEALASRRHTILECLVHGAFPLMVSEHCTIGAVVGDKSGDQKCGQPCLKRQFGLKDRLNYVFPLETDIQCRMYIYNPKELCLIEHMPEFLNLRIRWVRIEARREDENYVSRVVTSYREALDRSRAEEGYMAYASEAREKLEMLSRAGFTKGHYFRGVQ